MTDIAKILAKHKSGELSSDDAQRLIASSHTANLHHATIDLQRKSRTGAPEVIFGANKKPEQIADIFEVLIQNNQNVLATRITQEAADIVAERVDSVVFDALSRTLRKVVEPPNNTSGKIAVVAAGTSDLPVSEEAAITAEFYGNTVTRITDVGVAGLHRLLERVEELRSANVVIVAAGMEGALPSVVGGLVAVPVIAVPTSVGYGSNFGGLTALLGMLNSCTSNITVVNIDNGFGAGNVASLINKAHRS